MISNKSIPKMVILILALLQMTACSSSQYSSAPLQTSTTHTDKETALPGPIVLPTKISDQILASWSYPTGNRVWGTAFSDLNGDSFTDLAVADEWLGGVRIFLNNQKGGFQEGVEYATGEGTFWLVAADLDGDSYPDLAVSNQVSATLSVLLNQGDGSFQPPVDYATRDQPVYITAADLDRDSDNDLVAGHKSFESGEGKVGVWLNNGDGTFQEREDYNGRHIYHPFAGDLNGDSIPDLVGRSHEFPEVGVLMNIGDATFGPIEYYEIGNLVDDIAITDLNNDTYVDLVVARDPNIVEALFNNGNDSFQESVDYQFDGAIVRAPAVDLNGDSYPELIVLNPNFLISVFWNNGDGSFVSRTNYSIPTKYGRPDFIFVTDVDRDAYPDLVVSSNKGLHVFLNKERE